MLESLTGQIVDGGTLKQLKEHFFQEGKRMPLAFTVILQGINENPQEFLIMLHGLT